MHRVPEMMMYMFRLVPYHAQQFPKLLQAWYGGTTPLSFLQYTNPPYQVLYNIVYLEFIETKTNNTPLGLNLYSRILFNGSTWKHAQSHPSS